MKRNLNILFILLLLIGAKINSYAQNLPVACGGSEEWYGVIGDNGNSIFEWEITGGDIVRNYNDSILVKWNYVAGAHFIRVTETNRYGCTGEQIEDTVLITSPFVDIGLDGEICEGETYEFIATSDISTILWQDGSEGESFIASESGRYWVKVEDEFGCKNLDTATLIVHNLPDIDLGPDTSICNPEDIINLEAYGYSFVEWYDNNKEEPVESKYYLPNYEAYYSAVEQEIWVVVVDEFGCENSDTIIVRPCGEFEIPNAFTPNDDGANDTWVIEQLLEFQDITVDVYNRWGERVFHSDGYSSEQYWDGTDQRGKKLPMDAYYYVIELNNGEEPIVGTVTIIR